MGIAVLFEAVSAVPFCVLALNRSLYELRFMHHVYIAYVVNIFLVFFGEEAHWSLRALGSVLASAVFHQVVFMRAALFAFTCGLGDLGWSLLEVQEHLPAWLLRLRPHWFFPFGKRVRCVCVTVVALWIGWLHTRIVIHRPLEAYFLCPEDA